MRTIEQHASTLADGSTTSRALVEQCLDRIADPSGEGARAFIKVHAEQARAMADAMDALRRAGRAPSRFAGIPVSLKDLFDIAGEATPAGGGTHVRMEQSGFRPQDEGGYQAMGGGWPRIVGGLERVAGELG